MINLILTYILNISYLVLTRGIGEILKKKPLRSLKGDYCKANKKRTIENKKHIWEVKSIIE